MTPTEIEAILREAHAQLKLCSSCDAGLAMDCTCPKLDPRNTIAALIRVVESLRLPTTTCPECNGARAYWTEWSDEAERGREAAGINVIHYPPDTDGTVFIECLHCKGKGRI